MFHQQSCAETIRQAELCQQDTAGGTLSTELFRADDRTLRIWHGSSGDLVELRVRVQQTYISTNLGFEQDIFCSS